MIDFNYHVANYHGFPMEIKARGRSWPHRTLPRLLPGELLQTRGGGGPSVVTVKEPNSSAKSAAKVKSTPTAAGAPRRALKTAAKTTGLASRQLPNVQFNFFSEQKGVTSRKRVCLSTKLFDGEKPTDEQLDDAVDGKAENALSHNDNHKKLIIRPSLNATVLVNGKVLEENAEYALSHNDQDTIEGRCFTFEETATGLTDSSFIEAASTAAEITTAEATLPVEEKKNSPLCPVVEEPSLETLSTAVDCRTPRFVSLKEPNVSATAAAASALKVKSTPSSVSRIPRCALKTAATTISSSAKKQPLSVQFNRFSEQKGLTSRKRVYVPTKLFDGEKPSKQLDNVVDGNALSHNDLVTVVEQSHNSLTASFIEMETTTALPAEEEEEDNSLLHSVVGTTNTTVDCRTPTTVTVKEPSSSAKSAAKVKSTPIAGAGAVPRRALKTAAKTTGLASRQLPNVQSNCLSEQKGVMTSRKRVFASTKLFDGEKPSEQLDDAVDEKAENAEISHNDNHNKLIIRPSLNATVLVNEKVLEENAKTALSLNDQVSNEGLSITGEESHIGMTASFIETATASKTTTTTAETALPVAEEEENNSPPHSVVETSLETPSTTADCRTPSFVSLKEPNSPGKSASAAKVKSTPTAAAGAPRRALKTAAKTTGLASRQLPSVQFSCLSEQKGAMTSRKRVFASTKLFDGEKPTDEQLDDAVDGKAENAQISHDVLIPSEGLSFTGEESHIGMTESFIEVATASETTTTTTTTAAADLPVVAEEEEANSSPLHSVVEASSEANTTTTSDSAHCQTPSSVSLKEPNSNPTTTASASSASSSSVVVISTPTVSFQCALKTAATTSSAKRHPLSVQFNRFSEQKRLTSRKRVCLSTKLFDGEKPSEQLDDKEDDDDDDEDEEDGAADPCKGALCHLPTHGSPAEHSLRYHQGLKTFGCGFRVGAEVCLFRSRKRGNIIAHASIHYPRNTSCRRELVVDFLAGDDWPAEEAEQQRRLADPALQRQYKRRCRDQRSRMEAAREPKKQEENEKRAARKKKARQKQQQQQQQQQTPPPSPPPNRPKRLRSCHRG
ncbi:hypothetical protein TYRP_018918 [Tyrophagus putrescentiae]|nr:hypothetical protein TYRP_018918 [Tyrophagus putrescentiae]